MNMQLEEMMRHLPRSGTVSEWHLMLTFLKSLGIPFSINHAPDYETHQPILLKGGFNVTANALMAICFGPHEFVFTSGQAHWTEDNQGYGPASPFVYRYDTDTKEVTYRTHFKELRLHEQPQRPGFNGFQFDIIGLEALKKDHGFQTPALRVS